MYAALNTMDFAANINLDRAMKPESQFCVSQVLNDNGVDKGLSL